MEPRRPESIPGYEHPDDKTLTKSSSQVYYKTFTEGKKPKKNEKFKRAVNTKYSKCQTTVSDDGIESCPYCKSPAIYTCPCGYSDKRCCNEHIWYTGRDGKVKKGNPH